MSIAITEYRNARAFNENATSIDVEINHPEHGWIPYLLTDYDTDNTINNDDLRALIGDDYAPYVAPTQEELDEDAAINIRHIRDMFLTYLVDPIVSNPLRWESLSQEDQDAVRLFRQGLLDITQQATFPRDIYWPEKPNCIPDDPVQAELTEITQSS